MLTGYKTYIVAGMVAAIALVEGFLGIDIPGAEMQSDWLLVLAGAFGLSFLRSGMKK